MEDLTRAHGWRPDLSAFGARLALVRQRMGWNVKEAADHCRLPPQSWRSWEAGRTPRDLVAGVLADEGYECRTAGDSVTALDMIDQLHNTARSEHYRLTMATSFRSRGEKGRRSPCMISW